MPDFQDLECFIGLILSLRQYQTAFSEQPFSGRLQAKKKFERKVLIGLGCYLNYGIVLEGLLVLNRKKKYSRQLTSPASPILPNPQDNKIGLSSDLSFQTTKISARRDQVGYCCWSTG
jgi:hypothetical protein